MRRLMLALLVGVGARGDGLEVKTLRLPVVAGMTRAELRYTTPPVAATGALLLCPGYNGDGAALFTPQWVAFAGRHRLTLIGLSFASVEADLDPAFRRGYYYVEHGSAAVLRAGLKRITGNADTPLVIFGFSGGAHFAHRFVYRHPAQVRAWCAYGFGWSDAPEPGTRLPPGVFACGLEDERLPATVAAFCAARRAKGPVCWLGVPKTGHALDPAALDWVRGYFDAELARKPGDPEVWREGSDRGLDGFLVKCRFPSEACAARWDAFGRPAPAR